MKPIKKDPNQNQEDWAVGDLACKEICRHEGWLKSESIAEPELKQGYDRDGLESR